jgi:hypothetical protein
MTTTGLSCIGIFISISATFSARPRQSPSAQYGRLLGDLVDEDVRIVGRVGIRDVFAQEKHQVYPRRPSPGPNVLDSRVPGYVGPDSVVDQVGVGPGRTPVNVRADGGQIKADEIHTPQSQQLAHAAEYKPGAFVASVVLVDVVADAVLATWAP